MYCKCLSSVTLVSTAANDINDCFTTCRAADQQGATVADSLVLVLHSSCSVSYTSKLMNDSCWLMAVGGAVEQQSRQGGRTAYHIDSACPQGRHHRPAADG